MKGSATIRLGWPASELSPNARLHWAAKAKHVKAARREAYFATREMLAGRFPGHVLPAYVPLAVAIVARPPDRRRRDWDGLLSRMKAALDGIADALGVDDVRFRPSLTIAEPVKGGAVEITISPA